MNEQHEVEPYEAPTVAIYGDLADLTAANACGGVLDADFAAGTDFGHLTCTG
jgi:hypothetical protein